MFSTGTGIATAGLATAHSVQWVPEKLAREAGGHVHVYILLCSHGFGMLPNKQQIRVLL